MLNRPNSLIAGESHGGESSWKADEHPGLRLGWLYVLMLLPTAAVAGRLVYVQAVIPERFAAGVEQAQERFETVSSPNGRILSADGRVLAVDVPRFNVRMHYRWLEEPADEGWLRNQALGMLSPQQRRNRYEVEMAEQRVLDRRKAMWRQLAEVASMSPDELAEDRSRVQRRVERILAGVEERRQQKERKSARRQTAESAPGGDWWDTGWRVVRESLTTPPRRSRTDRLVVTEQEDYHTLIENIVGPVAVEIEAHPERFPGVRIESTTIRVYPQGSLAAHVVGTRTPISAEEIEEREKSFPDGDPLRYAVGDRIGRTGVELTYDRQLRGLPGRRRIVTKRGEVVHSQLEREPRPGDDVVLTLDMSLQQRAEQLLQEVLNAESEEDQPVPRGGCIVAVDVHTGAVLTAASAPTYDLQLVVEPDADRWQQLLDDPRRPFFPRMTRMTLAPGSVFKTLTAIAAVESGLDPQAQIFCQGYLDTPDKHRCYVYRHFGSGHGDLNLADAIARSCNVYFFTVARRMGPEPILEYARGIGFGESTGIDLPGERAGNLPTAAQSRRFPGETLGLAIGQARLTVTPLQIVRMMAAVANGGSLVTPHVVSHTGPSGLNSAGSTIPAARRIPGLTQATLRDVREGLQKVVAHPRGTGYKNVRLKEISIAGKTGTAEVGGEQPDHAWFAGYVPAERPRIAFVVVLEHGGPGGSAAGPVAKQLVEAFLETGALQPAQISLRD